MIKDWDIESQLDKWVKEVCSAIGIPEKKVVVEWVWFPMSTHVLVPPPSKSRSRSKDSQSVESLLGHFDPVNSFNMFQSSRLVETGSRTSSFCQRNLPKNRRSIRLTQLCSRLRVPNCAGLAEQVWQEPYLWGIRKQRSQSERYRKYGLDAWFINISICVYIIDYNCEILWTCVSLIS